MLVVLASIIPAFSAVKEVKLCGAMGWYPYYVKKGGQIQGASIDIMKEIGKKQGFRVKVMGDIPWKRQLAMVKSGQLDVIGGIYYTSERARIYKYTDAFMTDEARVFVKKGKEFSFKDFSDLKGKTGGRPSGGSYGEKFDKYAASNLKMEKFEGKDSLVKMLLAGRVDYLVFAYWDMNSYLKEKGYSSQVKVLPKAITKNNVHFIFSKKSAAVSLVPKVNSELKKMKRDGRLKRIINKY